MGDQDFLAGIKARLAADLAALPETWPCERHGPYPSAKVRDGQYACPACESEAGARERVWREAWAARERWEHVDVPLRYQNRTLSNWRPRSAADTKALKAIREWLDQLGNGDLSALVLTGPVGVGKTHLACGLLAECVRAGHRALYRAVPGFLSELRSAYDRESGMRPDEVLRPLREADVLVLDEVAGSRGTVWETEVLGALIDDRYRDGGALILLTNATPDELPRWIGERGADRLAEFGMILTLAGESYRARAPKDVNLQTAPPAIERPSDAIVIELTYMGEPCTRTLQRCQRSGRIELYGRPYAKEPA